MSLSTQLTSYHTADDELKDAADELMHAADSEVAHAAVYASAHS